MAPFRKWNLSRTFPQSALLCFLAVAFQKLIRNRIFLIGLFGFYAVFSFYAGFGVWGLVFVTNGGIERRRMVGQSLLPIAVKTWLMRFLPNRMGRKLGGAGFLSWNM